MIAESNPTSPAFIEWLDCSTLRVLGAERDFYERYDLGGFIWPKDGSKEPSAEVVARQQRFFGTLDGFVSSAATLRQAAASRITGLSNLIASELAADDDFDKYCRAFERDKHEWESLYATGAKSILWAYCIHRKGL